MNPNGNTFVIHLKSGKSFQVSGAYKDTRGPFSYESSGVTQFVTRDQTLMAEFATEQIEAIIVTK